MKKIFALSFVSALALLFCSGDLFARGPIGARAGAGRTGAINRTPSDRGQALSGSQRIGQQALANERSHGVRQQGLNGTTPTRQQLQDYLNVRNHESARQRDQRPGPETIEAAQGSLGDRLETRQQWADQIRNDLATKYDQMFTPAWYRDHPNAWHLTHPHADAWAVATMAAVAGWVGLAVQPASYVYNSAVVYDDGNVYVEGQPVATADEYAAEAEAIADNGQDVPADAQWLPLGVFAIAPQGQADANVTVQLAVSKDGTIRGTYYDLVTGTTLPVKGAVDTKTQRVAWTVGDNDHVVMETTLAGLTEQQAVVLAHFGKARAQNWTMVRLENKGDAQ